MPIIGREPPAEIIVAVQQVSALHAEIRHLGGDLYTLRDLGSTNGTYVSGRRIEMATIRLSDQVSLGSVRVDLRAFEHLIPKIQLQGPVVASRGIPVQPEPPRHGRDVDQSHQVPGPRVYAQPGMGTELAVALASQKSYVGAACLTWLLYFLLYIPGLVMNIVYLNEARRTKRMTGQSPSGMGCLVSLLVVYVVLPVVGILVFILLLAAGAARF